MSQNPEWMKLIPEHATQWLANRRVEEVECIVPDMVGISRGKTMPAKKFSETGRTYLPTSIFYQTVTGAYADMDIKDQWTETDMVLKPDLSTACAAPCADCRRVSWSPGRAVPGTSSCSPRLHGWRPAGGLGSPWRAGSGSDLSWP